MAQHWEQNTNPRAASVEVRFFGLPRVLVGGVSLKIISSRTALEMLARIARPDAEAHERDAVAHDVWPELPASEARAALRRHLHYLDQALARAGQHRLVLREATRLRLDAHGGSAIDARTFERFRGLPSVTEEGLSAYAGEFLESYDNPWVLKERARLREWMLRSLRAVSLHFLQLEQPLKARQWSDELRRMDPLSEDSLRIAMAVRAANADVAGALAECDAFEAMLRADLGVRLSEETLGLRSDIAARQGPQPRRFGFPDVARLVGRANDLMELGSALTKHPLVTLVGPPGIGKTSLALHAAARASEAGDLPAYFVDLTAARDEAGVESAILDALALNADGPAMANADLASIVRRRPMLLVLDNCEQAVVAVRSVVKRLHTVAHMVRILATSRVLLDIRGECLVTLEPLSLEHAVELFLDRARLVRPHLRRTSRIHERIAALCRRLDGLPLAIELAAARLRSTSLHATLPPTQPLSLRATFEWSAQLLDPAELRLFRRLACFSGGFTSLDAAELDETSEPLAQAALERLADHSLIRAPGPTDEFPRYRLLEPLREFAAALLAEADENAALRERHARLFARRYVSRSDDLNGPHSHAFAEEVERDRSNLRTALDALVDEGIDPALGAELCIALQRSWFLQGLVVEALRWTELLLQRPDLDDALRLKILFMRAVMARHQCDYREAIARYREHLAIQRAAGDGRRVALTLIHLAGCLCTTGETEAARASARDALLALEEPGDAYFVGHAYVALGLAENYAGRLAEAEIAHREGLARFIVSESTADVAVCLSNLATCALSRDDLDAAEALAQESIEQAETARAALVIGASLCVLANVAVRRRDLRTARTRVGSALNVAQETNDYERLAETFEAAVRIATIDDDAALGARMLGAADALRARCSAVRPHHEAVSISALESTLRQQLGASSFEAKHIGGMAQTVADAIDGLRDFLVERSGLAHLVHR